MINLIIVILFLVTGFILPWWTIAIIGFIYGWWLRASWLAFKNAFIYCSAAWAFLALVFDVRSGLRLSPRIGALYMTPYPLVAVLLTGMIGGLIAAFAATAGASLHRLIISFSIGIDFGTDLDPAARPTMRARDDRT